MLWELVGGIVYWNVKLQRRKPGEWPQGSLEVRANVRSRQDQVEHPTEVSVAKEHCRANACMHLARAKRERYLVA